MGQWKGILEDNEAREVSILKPIHMHTDICTQLPEIRSYFWKSKPVSQISLKKTPIIGHSQEADITT